MPKPFRALVPATAMILLLLSLGCSEKLAKQKGITDADLMARGQQKSDQKKFADAAEAYQMLLERFPNSPLAPRAQFGLASSRMNLQEFIEAEVAFDDFLRLYPADPKVPDALFLKGELLQRQIQAVGRSQDKTRESIDTYKRFLEKEPDSPRSAEAASRIKEMRKRLVLQEETVVSHLLSRKLYESAEVRARRVFEEYPDASPTPTLLSLLAVAMEKQGKKEEAAQIRKAQAEQFPDTGAKEQSAGASIEGELFRGRRTGPARNVTRSPSSRGTSRRKTSASREARRSISIRPSVSGSGSATTSPTISRCTSTGPGANRTTRRRSPRTTAAPPARQRSTEPWDSARSPPI